MRRRKAKHINALWQIEDQNIPVKVIYEWRSSRRVSIGKSSVIARFPIIGRSLAQKDHEQWAKNWLTQQLRGKPSLFDHLTPTLYKDSQVVITTRKEYKLQIVKSDRKIGKAILKEGNIVLTIPEVLVPSEESKMIHALIGRILSNDNLQWITNRVFDFNMRYDIGKVKQVRIKNNKSNWGSCSSNGNINLSVRLLFAPEDVQDYVIVHELAHLRELNHTKRFWNIVEGIMPDYKQKERWLREHGHLCDF